MPTLLLASYYSYQNIIQNDLDAYVQKTVPL